MSYIHDALKKAQREKESLTGKYTHLWSGVQFGDAVFKRTWLVPFCVLSLAVVVSSYSWLQSLDELALYKPTTESNDLMKQVAPPSLPVTRKQKVAPPSLPATPKPQAVQQNPIRHQPPKKRKPVEKKVRPPVKSDVKPVVAKKTSPPPTRKVTREPPSRGSSNSLYERAVALQKQGRLEEAKRLYEAALRKTPNLVSALNNLGAISIQQHQYDEARKVLEKAVRIDPLYVDAYYNLACLHAKKKDLSRGIFYLKKSISLEPAARDWAKGDEDLQALRNHSEYDEILRGD